MQEVFEDILFMSKSCTLATASKDGKPEAATIHYTANDDYQLFFNTFSRYRKYQNLTKNPRASVVITRDLSTVQMDGTVEELTGKSADEARAMLLEKLPEDEKFLTDEKGTFFQFTPTWIRVLADDGSGLKEEVLMG